MQQQYIKQQALQQSAYDFNCLPQDFLKHDNVLTIAKPHPKAKKCYEFPLSCHLITYGHNIVASCHEKIQDDVKAYIEQYPNYSAFETPQLLKLNDFLKTKQMQVAYLSEYFLPDLKLLKPLACAYKTKILHQADFKDLYIYTWSNALCASRAHLDVLGVGAYDGERLIGLSACSMDGEEMWQIGIDVLPEYRHQGIAASLTSQLACEIIRYGKVPFYCCAWGNIASKRNAYTSGFKTAWIEMTATFIETN